MTINTKKVIGRRTVRYESYADMLADAEAMLASKVKLIGNWSLGQILQHLATACHVTVDGVDMGIPKPIRFFGTLLLKKRFLNKKIPTGVKIPARMQGELIASPDIDAGLALEALRKAVVRIQSASTHAPHMVFGQLSPEEWEKWNLRHAENHMSFVVPNA